ncbi:inositol monophosphatase family protein, partial [Streptococcus pyogenes]
LEQGLIGLNTGLYAKNVDGLANLANHTLGTRSFGSAGIGFARVLKGQLLAHASYLFPWDYAAACILGPSLGYQLMTMEGKEVSFQGR